MKDDVAALVAYVAACLITRKSPSSIYDYGLGRYHNINGTVASTNVNVYDYDTGSHFGGSGNPNDLSLYHYGHGHHVSLKVTRSKFDGYDYGGSGHFSGSVSGASITLYDYGTSSYRNYSI